MLPFYFLKISTWCFLKWDEFWSWGAFLSHYFTIFVFSDSELNTFVKTWERQFLIKIPKMPEMKIDLFALRARKKSVKNVANFCSQKKRKESYLNSEFSFLERICNFHDHKKQQNLKNFFFFNFHQVHYFLRFPPLRPSRRDSSPHFLLSP